MRYLSLFSGIGGFELGLGPEHECVGYSEIEPNAIKIYQKHFPNHKNYGDITTINAEDLPDFDMLVGGFPCQAFSIAGNRRGFEDTRGTLFFDIARIAKTKKPTYLLLENVKGLLSHDNGRTFGTILSTMDELGYDAEWCVFDSFHFGAAPRPRVFIYAVLRNEEIDVREGAVENLPLYTTLSTVFGNSGDTLQEDMRSAERIIRTFAKLPDWLDSWDTIYSEEGKAWKRSDSERN